MPKEQPVASFFGVSRTRYGLSDNRDIGQHSHAKSSRFVTAKMILCLTSLRQPRDNRTSDAPMFEGVDDLRKEQMDDNTPIQVKKLCEVLNLVLAPHIGCRPVH